MHWTKVRRALRLKQKLRLLPEQRLLTYEEMREIANEREDEALNQQVLRSGNSLFEAELQPSE